MKSVEIKRAIRDFKQIANDYLQSHYDSHQNNLSRFFAFIYENEVIKQITEPLMNMKVDIDNLFVTSNGYWIRHANLPIDKNERIATVLQLMEMENKRKISFENISSRMNPREKSLPRLLAIFNQGIIAPVIRDLFVKLDDFIEDEIESNDDVSSSVLNIFYGNVTAQQGANFTVGQHVTQKTNIEKISSEQHNINRQRLGFESQGSKYANHEVNDRKIFISHSTEDKLIVEPLIDLLEGLGLRSDSIFCSSFEGYKIPYGEDFLGFIKKELSENTIVLFLLSENFYNSPICMCEMGATWIKSAKHFPILIPPLTYANMKGVISSQTQSLVINKSNELDGFITQLFGELDLSLKIEIWNRKKEQFLLRINELLNTCT
ncbi:toll/interleukin-1 receptor domain-containing protein [Calidifontibacillus oryziterrae]|uniref:toll/interleukin-1 receptor domain-containing protein n=1 Tax=Calidifontibacillus oryziterrae TaxID=1191699 RepID=UPI0002D9310F|nr:toll/interleukin-1 receptor domain-containing protein [Calidifontibacillus oryziterrae]